jgi:hypothetical protein
LFPLFSTSVVDTSGKLADGAIYTGGNLQPNLLTPEAKFATSINNTSGIGVKSATCVIDTETCEYVHE